jgi:hypothetical protein
MARETRALPSRKRNIVIEEDLGLKRTPRIACDLYASYASP